MRHSLHTIAAAALLAAAVSAQIPFTPGNLIVSRVGDGITALGSNAAPVFLDEYTTTGTLVQTITLPSDAATTPVGQHRCVVRGSSTAQGRLTISGDGFYLMVAGFDADAGTAKSGYEDMLAGQVPRVVARIDLIGTVDTTTALTDAYDARDIRAVCSDNGFRFWTAGSVGGVHFVANLGDTTSTLINAGAPTNLRCIDIFHGDIYTTTAQVSGPAILQLGTGLETSPGAVQNYLPGFPSAGSEGPYDFYFADRTTMYLADDDATTQGIQKWQVVGGVWTLQYTLGIPTQGARGLTGFTQDGITTLWATSQAGFSSSNGNDLIEVVDVGPSSVATVVTSAVPGTMFRGVRRYDVPSLGRFSGLSCGTADIKSTGSGRLGTDVLIDVVNPVGIPLISFGTSLVMAPLCGCTLLNDIGFLFFGSSATLPIPNNTTLLGAQVFWQGVDFLDPAAAGCAVLPFATLTDGYAISVQ